MKVSALQNTDIWFNRLMSEAKRGEIEGQSLVNVPVNNIVRVDRVVWKQDGDEVNNRPYLEISGSLQASQPEVDLPFGVKEVMFSQSPSIYMGYRYDFTDAQLAELVLRGMFTKDFQVPREMMGIDWELPGHSDFLIVSPIDFNDPPIVLATVRDQDEHAIDWDSSGYDLVEYFPELLTTPHFGFEDEVEQQADTVLDLEDEDEAHVDNDLFAEENKEAIAAKKAAEHGGVESEEADKAQSSKFEELLSQIEGRLSNSAASEVESESEFDTEEVTSPESEVEKLYRERIAREVEESRHRPASLGVDPTTSELSESEKAALDDVEVDIPDEVENEMNADDDKYALSEEEKLELTEQARAKIRNKAAAALGLDEKEVSVNENGELDLD